MESKLIDFSKNAIPFISSFPNSIFKENFSGRLIENSKDTFIRPSPAVFSILVILIIGRVSYLVNKLFSSPVPKSLSIIIFPFEMSDNLLINFSSVFKL